MTRRKFSFGLAPRAGAAASDRPPASTSGRSALDFLIREKGVAFEGGIAYGPQARHRLDVFTPIARPGGPIVLFFYGGSWTSGDRGLYEFVGTALAGRGLTTVVADYRLFPEVRHPGFVEDAALAYGWVDRHLARAPAGRRPVVLMGHSAGAHIAALLAVDPSLLAAAAPEAAPPAGLVGLAGPYAFDPTTWEATAEIFAPAAATEERARPVAFVGRSRPIPALLVVAGRDRTVHPFNARDFAAALEAAGGTVRLVTHRGVGHVGLITALAKPLRWRADVLGDVVAFVEAAAGGTERPPPAVATDDQGRSSR